MKGGWMLNGNKEIIMHDLFNKGEKEKPLVLVFWHYGHGEIEELFNKCGIDISLIFKVNFGRAILLKDIESTQIKKIQKITETKHFKKHSNDAIAI